MDPFIGEIRMFAGDFAPRGWASCDGQLLPIAQNGALAALIGDQFGGDGSQTTGLPDLRGRMPMHRGLLPLGSVLGEVEHEVTIVEMPAHSHVVGASSGTGTQDDPVGGVPAASRTDTVYSTAPSTGLMAQPLSETGAGEAHENRSPYLGVNFIICLIGLWPSRA
jgi:microcystin-dependent protein